MKHTLSVLVEDESGVLTRIAGLFARRGFNIESLAVGPAEEIGISRITMVVPSDERTIEQLTKQLYKLVNILKVEDIVISSPNGYIHFMECIKLKQCIIFYFGE